MKVAQIITDTNIGGGGRALLNYLSKSNRQDFQPWVILPRGSLLLPRIQDLDVPYTQIDAMADKSYDPKAKKALHQALKEIDPALVHTHGSLTGRMVATQQKRLVLYTKHCAFPPSGLRKSPPARGLTNLLDRRYASAVVAVGHSAQEMLVESGINAQRIKVLYNGVEPLNTPSPEERAHLRDGYHFQSEDFVVGILARVEEYKGHDDLFHALELLRKQNIPAKLLVAGEGRHLQALRDRSKSLPQGTVYFAGFVNQVEVALGAMDVQVNASYESETSCLSLLEGMSMGLPAVASDCGGNGYLIRSGENGILVPKQNPTALAEALTTLYQDKTLYQTLSEGAKTRFFSEFTAEHYAKNLEAVYHDLYTAHL